MKNQKLTNFFNNYLEGKVKLKSTSKRNNQCAKILNLLKQRDFVSIGLLSRFAPQYNVRIYELRNGLFDGFKYGISSFNNDGVNGYVLTKG